MEVQVRTEVTGEMVINRRDVQREVNMHKPTLDREVFKKTKKEKEDLSIAKSKFKSSLNTVCYSDKRDELISAIVSKVPRWGASSSIIIVKNLTKW